MAIRAIALDIDGTLTNDQKVITPRTKKALMDAQEAGIKLILSSGRPIHGLRALAHELELDRHNGLLVAFNFGAPVRSSTGEVSMIRLSSRPCARRRGLHTSSTSSPCWSMARSSIE